MINKSTIQAVFFDLDGTLLDTAPDLAYALNQVLKKRGLNPVPLSKFRFHIYGGGPTMIQFGFGIDSSHEKYESIHNEFLEIYMRTLTMKTQLFSGMDKVLNFLDQHSLPWGIVTNKPAWLTEPILSHFGLGERCRCVISGDTLMFKKPHPQPLLHACQLANVNPIHCAYIGDTHDDIIASKAANMFAVGVTYGYHPEQSQPQNWGADKLVESPLEILNWLETFTL